MDVRYRNFYAKHLLSIRDLSEQRNPGAALIIRGGVQVSSAYSVGTGTEYNTLPIIEAIIRSYSYWGIVIAPAVMFCSYFPSLEELLAIYTTDIRTIYYMGDITDERSVRFLNTCTETSFEIIKLEFE